MLRDRFERKLALFFTALVAVVQLGALVAVIVTTNHNVRQQVEGELGVGARVVGRLLDSRSQQLLQSVRVLADDFGFRRAVGTGDAPTIRSALGNHANRIDADMAAVLDPDGRVRASSVPALAVDSAFPLRKLLQRAVDEREAVGFGLIGERAYQLVVVPVRAPRTIAWACLGFAIDDALTMELSRLTGGEVSIEVESGEDVRVLATSLESHADAVAVPAAASEREVHLVTTGRGDQLVTSRELAGDDGGRLRAVLQIAVADAIEPYDPLKRQLLVLAAVALLLTIVGAFWLARMVSQPVRQLLGAAERVSTGDYAHPVHIEQTDELGDLARAFERMQQAVREREDRIIHQAYHDELTGLPNRGLMRDRLNTEIERARREGHQVAVIVMDVNRFKEINDSLGHEIGDHVLRTVGERLSASMRATDTIARLGGDEFGAVAACQDVDDAQTVIERLRSAWTNPLTVGPTELHIEHCIGMALFPDHGDEVETLVRRADIAMYVAKDRRVASVVYEKGWDERHQYELALMADLRIAADQDQFTMEYQPQIELGSGLAKQVEALVRWQHPRLGRIGPGDFVPLAENAGYIQALTRWIVAEVVRQCGAWRAEDMDFRISVNISALDLLDDSLPEFVATTLEQHAVPANAISLEITESAVMQDTTFALRVLRGLKRTGVRLSIDDFGTGESSLAQLRRLPVDELKIDKSFIFDLQESGMDDHVEAIVRSAIDLGHNMGLSVVAEGVETAFSQDWLVRSRCDLAQGFLFSKPLPPDDFIRWARSYSGHAAPAAGDDKGE